jgi:hypothetical protein
VSGEYRNTAVQEGTTRAAAIGSRKGEGADARVGIGPVTDLAVGVGDCEGDSMIAGSRAGEGAEARVGIELVTGLAEGAGDCEGDSMIAGVAAGVIGLNAGTAVSSRAGRLGQGVRFAPVHSTSLQEKSPVDNGGGTPHAR